jgi:hypothetical protein
LFLGHNNLFFIFLFFYLFFFVPKLFSTAQSGTGTSVSTATPTTQSLCHLHQTSSIRREAFFGRFFDPLATAQPSFQVITAFQGLDL